MADIDKNQAMVDFLLTCPTVQNNKLFFNFAEARNNNNQFMTLSNSANLHEPYVDGSVEKQYKFILIGYKSISYLPIVKSTGHPDENITDMLEFQEVIDWIHQQADNKVFPNFGTNCIIDKMETSSDNPVLYDVDESVAPPLAKYSVTIQVDYLDTSKCMWNKQKSVDNHENIVV